jgi:DNA helicase-2/ATP-dependent DNA helicase PcrA
MVVRAPDAESEHPASETASKQASERRPTEAAAIAYEEEALCDRVVAHLSTPRPSRPPPARADDDLVLLSLRDQVASARLEDVPALVTQMEQVAAVASLRGAGVVEPVDPASPYFGHLRLRERGRGVRDVLIGRTTYVEPRADVRIVDWRHAPVSQLYYRYEEGAEYEEQFGDREVEGVLLVRRTVTITDGRLERVTAPQGAFVRSAGGDWQRLAARQVELSGGQGVAVRAEHLRPAHVPGTLGAAGGAEQREDRHLPEIAALLDPHQFAAITQPDSGLVVVQGGAGSGKTTIGVHRMAYLAYQSRARFTPERMLVVVGTPALRDYIAQLLDALGLASVPVVTFAAWAAKMRARVFDWLVLPREDDAPPEVSRLKTDPALLALLARRAAALRQQGRLHARDALWLWADTLTDRAALGEAVLGGARPRLSAEQLERAWRWCSDRCPAVVEWAPEDGEDGGQEAEHRGGRDGRPRTGHDGPNGGGRDAAHGGLGHADYDQGQGGDAEAALDQGRGRGRDRDQEGDLDLYGDRDLDPYRERACEQDRERERTRDHELDPDLGDHIAGADGLIETRDEHARLDPEDDALLLRAYQLLCGPLRNRKRKPLAYEHLFIDEAQDLAAVDLCVLAEIASAHKSITLAGDTSQRLNVETGFADWDEVIAALGLDHTAIEPLRIAYRSTREVLAFARAVLGPLADPEPPIAPRSGASVEHHAFPSAGAAAAFLGDALRSLFIREPRATVAVLARYAEQAETYYLALRLAELPHLRLVKSFDFVFRPGIDVTEIRQVKGLEYDYVVLVDVTASTYPDQDEARYLLHIGATRAAHQLWVLSSGPPSPLLRPWLGA